MMMSCEVTMTSLVVLGVKSADLDDDVTLTTASGKILDDKNLKSHVDILPTFINHK